MVKGKRGRETEMFAGEGRRRNGNIKTFSDLQMEMEVRDKMRKKEWERHLTDMGEGKRKEIEIKIVI